MKKLIMVAETSVVISTQSVTAFSGIPRKTRGSTPKAQLPRRNSPLKKLTTHLLDL